MSSTWPGAIVDCLQNCGGCFVWALKNKVCLWKVPQQRGNLEWCNMFLFTFSGKSKDPCQYTRTHTHPSLSLHLSQLFLSLTHTPKHTHTISSVYDTENYNITTTALTLVYWNVDLERPQRENNKLTATFNCN